MIRLQVLLFSFVFIQTFETQAFVLSKHYKSKERQTLERVLSLLSHENFPSFEDHFSLGDWLSQRAIYFVAPFEPLAMSRSNQLINYPNLENIIPMDVEGNQGILVFMKNEGAFIYHAGKARSVLYTVRFETASRSINIPVISPRAGIIRTGQVFFDRPIKDELSLRGFQISQLVHEARHSDGHGPEAGMLHAACPDTHFAAGLPACDQYANGPYGMEAESLRRFRTALKDKITEVGLQFLMINELASRERILSKRAVDPTPESATISY